MIFEAFLEAAPQSTLQIMIVLKQGLVDHFQILTILTSLISLTIAAVKLFWEFPTKASFVTISIGWNSSLLLIDFSEFQITGIVLQWNNDHSANDDDLCLFQHLFPCNNVCHISVFCLRTTCHNVSTFDHCYLEVQARVWNWKTCIRNNHIILCTMLDFKG